MAPPCGRQWSCALNLATIDSNISPREFMALSPDKLLSEIVVETKMKILPSPAPYKYMIMAQTIARHKLTFSLIISSQSHSSSPRKARQTTMISSRKLAQLSKKWQGMGAIGRRRVTTMDKEIHPSCSSVAGKGHFVVYSSDGRRFEIPLAYLHTTVFGELLRMSKEEFGFTSDGRITLPCDTAVMEYVMCLLRREASEDVERALLNSVVMTCHHPSRMMQPASGINQQFSVCSS